MTDNDLLNGVWIDDNGAAWRVIGLIDRPAVILHRLRTLNEENGARYRDGPQHPQTEERVLVLGSPLAETYTRLVPDPHRTLASSMFEPFAHGPDCPVTALRLNPKPFAMAQCTCRGLA